MGTVRYTAGAWIIAKNIEKRRMKTVKGIEKISDQELLRKINILNKIIRKYKIKFLKVKLKDDYLIKPVLHGKVLNMSDRGRRRRKITFDFQVILNYIIIMYSFKLFIFVNVGATSERRS